MDVILKEDFLALGYVGDKVRVKGGYARNFLLPRGIAVEGSRRNERILNHELFAIMAKRQRRKAEAEEFGKTLGQVTVEFTLKIGQGGRSFGSVTSRDIEAKLKTLGYQVDKRQVRILEPIRTAGVHGIEVRLHSEVSVPVTVKVTAEREVVVETASAEGTEGRKRGRGPRQKRGAEGADDAPAVETSEVPVAE